MMKTLQYVVITPVRDEERYIGLTIQSMSQQTILPQEWIIVDDGSADQTSRIIDEASVQYPWIRAFHRSNRGFRKSGGGVIEAFYSGYANLSSNDWDFIVKLDGDLSFQSGYFEECLRRFSDDPKLGIAGGVVWSFVGGSLINDGKSDPNFHVRGATKIYRRKCWEDIKPLITAPGWDTIDEVKANMLGWTTRTFQDLRLIQNKATGIADGRWGNWQKNGLANYISGYHPLFMLGKCLKRAIVRRAFIESIALGAGFCSGYLKGIPQVNDKALRQYLRKQQLRRILGQPSIYGQTQ